MRLVFALFCSYISLAWGIQAEQISISPSAQSLQIIIPTKSKSHIKEAQKNKIEILIEEAMQGQAISKTLHPPFISLKIDPFEQQTLITLQAQGSISLSQTQNLNELKLFFGIYPDFQWWRYISVIALLLCLIAFLLYLKRKQKRHSPDYFKVKQQFIDKNCTIIILESKETSYLVFSNQKNCILLDKINHTKDIEGN